MPSAPRDITLTLNGQPKALTADPQQPALSTLREALGQCSLPTGCAPQGICGSCVALVNGRPRLTCTLRSASLSGKTIETQGGFSTNERAALTRAFAATGLSRCGYSAPSLALQTIHLLRREPSPSPSHIDRALTLYASGCTPWPRIREAVSLTGRLLRGAEPEPPAPALPPEAAAILGQRTHIEDMIRPGMLHIVPCFTPHPRCRVTDITAPDGVTVLTAADLPNVQAIGDRPLLVALGDETRCASDAVALVIGHTLAEAQAGAAAIQLTATRLEPVRYADIGDIVDEHHIMQGTPPPFDTVVHAVSAEVSVAASMPAFLQPAAALVVPLAGGQLSIYSHAPDPMAERELLAGLLGCATGDLLVEAIGCDGHASAQTSAQVAGWAAAVAQQLQRPARVALTHEDSVRLRPGRPEAWASVSIQADADGNLLAIDGELLIDAGGYGRTAAALSRRAALLMAGPYRTPHLDVRARCAQTHNPAAGEGRGLGRLPGTAALEHCMDLLAEATGQDPVAIRARNLANNDHQAVLAAAAAVQRAAQAAGRTAGLACAVQSLGRGGPELARAVLTRQPDGAVMLHTSASGPAQEAEAARIAAAVTGLPAGRFVVTSSTAQPIATADWPLQLEAIRAAAAAMAAGEAGTGEARRTLEPDELAAPGFVAEVAILDSSGALEELVVATSAGPDQPRATACLEGAVLEGLSAALSERRRFDEHGVADDRYRALGWLSARAAPDVRAIVLPASAPQPLEGAAILAVAPALAAAIRAHGEDPGDVVPMSASCAARAAGVTHRQGMR